MSVPSWPSHQMYSSFWPRACTRTAKRREACRARSPAQLPAPERGCGRALASDPRASHRPQRPEHPGNMGVPLTPGGCMQVLRNACCRLTPQYAAGPRQQLKKPQTRACRRLGCSEAAASWPAGRFLCSSSWIGLTRMGARAALRPVAFRPLARREADMMAGNERVLVESAVSTCKGTQHAQQP
jgi:hypothetical protein